MSSEQELQINPVVGDSIVHNNKVRQPELLANDGFLPPLPTNVLTSTAMQVLTNLHSLTASLFGVSAGILGLESYSGFLFYIVFSIITTILFYTFQLAPGSVAEGRSPIDTSRYYRGALDLWTGGITNGLPGFILTWTLFYGLVRA